MIRACSLLLISLLIVVTSGCGNSTDKVEDNDWSAEGLKGKVKSVIERNFQAQSQSGNWGKGSAGQSYLVKNFDKNGFKQSENSYFVNDNSLYGRSTYEYDDGNLTKINRYGADNNKAGYDSLTERLGKIRPLKFDNYFVVPGETAKTGFTEMVWEGARVNETKRYDQNSRLISQSLSTYDENNHVAELKRETFGQNSTQTIRYTYLSYDDKGNWTSALKQIIGFNFQEIIERVYEYYAD